MSPKVSVLLPTYNRKAWLEQAMASVLSQSVDLELLVLDNGSSDGTWGRLTALAETEPRLRIFRFEQNNLPRAYSFLFEQALGDYTTFFTDDDEMLPEGLTRRAAVMDAHPGMALVWSPVRIMDGEGKDQGESPLWVRFEEDRIGGAGDLDSLMVSNYIPMPAALFRSCLGRTCESPKEDLGPTGDWNFWLSIIRKGDAAFLRQPTVRLRFHASQVTQQQGFANRGFLDGHLALWRHWMLHADPPFVPSPRAWQGMVTAQVNMAIATHGKDEKKVREELDRLVAIRLEQQKGMATAPATLEPPLREAFLFEPDWRGSSWVRVILGYVTAFAPEEPVALVIPLDPTREDLPPLEDAQQAVLQVIALSKREAFPAIVFLDQPGEGLETLRTYDRAQWVHLEAGPTLGLRGALGTRLALACAALGGRPS